MKIISKYAPLDKASVISKMELTQFDPSTNYLVVQKQTKGENIFEIEFRLTQIDQNNRLKQQLFNLKREATLLTWCHLSQKRDLLTKNVSFVR